MKKRICFIALIIGLTLAGCRAEKILSPSPSWTVISPPSDTPTVTKIPILTPTTIPLPTKTTISLPSTPTREPTETPLPPSATPTIRPYPTWTASLSSTLSLATPSQSSPLGWIAVAFSHNSKEGIALVRSDGSEWKDITKGDRIFNSYSSPSWSPDGHWLVYTRTDGYDVDQLFIMDITGGRITQLTSDPIYKHSPAWSPDGQWIAYSEYKDPDGQGDLYVINRYGRGRMALANSEFDERNPAWSPGGKQIAYIYEKKEPRKYSKNDLYIMNSDGSDKHKIMGGLTLIGGPKWAPDGKEIAIFAMEDCALYIVNADGSNLHRETNTSQVASLTTWSPNGKYIVYNGTYSGCCHDDKCWNDISILTVATGAVSKFLAYTEYIPVEMDWSPVPNLLTGETYVITAAGNKLSLRASPSVNAEVLDRMFEGDKVTILEGPVDADDYYWWRMRTADGVEGWAVEVEGWYQWVK